MTVALFETLLVFSVPFALFVIRFRSMRPPAHTHPLSGKPPAKHISSLPWNAAGLSSVMFSSVSLGVECFVSMVAVLGCVSCCCGSSIGCRGGSVCKCMYVVSGSGGAWAGGGAVVPSLCFLWSEVSLCAC